MTALPCVLRGTCPVCGIRGLALDSDGKLAPHTTPCGAPPGRCKGTGQPARRGFVGIASTGETDLARRAKHVVREEMREPDER